MPIGLGDGRRFEPRRRRCACSASVSSLVGARCGHSTLVKGAVSWRLSLPHAQRASGKPPEIKR